jgi:hypothetical protein
LVGFARAVSGALAALRDAADPELRQVIPQLEQAEEALRGGLTNGKTCEASDARIGLLSGSAWEAARSTICRSLGHSVSANETIIALSRELDQTYRAVAANLPNNPAARVEAIAGQDELVLTALDKLEEPASLVQLREAVNSRLPRVDLPDILLEIAARTGFASKFTHVSERASRVGDFVVSICAVLIAEGLQYRNGTAGTCRRGGTEARSAILGESELYSQ